MNNDIDKFNKKIKKAFFITMIVAFSLLVVAGGIIFYNMLPVSSTSREEISFNVEPGSSKNQIINNLKKEGLIKSKNLTKIIVKLGYQKGFLAGNYKLSKSMPLMDILDNLPGDFLRVVGDDLKGNGRPAGFHQPLAYGG